MPADFQARTEPADLIEMELAYRRHPTFAGLGRYRTGCAGHAEPARRFPCRPALLPLLFTLAACQSQNPSDESAPIPPAPPVEQIQAPTYPAAPRTSPATSTGAGAARQRVRLRSAVKNCRKWSPAPSINMACGRHRAMLRAMYGSAPAPARKPESARPDNYGYGPHVGVGRYGGGYGTGMASAPACPSCATTRRKSSRCASRCSMRLRAIGLEQSCRSAPERQQGQAARCGAPGRRAGAGRLSAALSAASGYAPNEGAGPRLSRPFPGERSCSAACC